MQRETGHSYATGGDVVGLRGVLPTNIDHKTVFKEARGVERGVRTGGWPVLEPRVTRRWKGLVQLRPEPL